MERPAEHVTLPQKKITRKILIWVINNCGQVDGRELLKLLKTGTLRTTHIVLYCKSVRFNETIATYNWGKMGHSTTYVYTLLRFTLTHMIW